MARAQAEPTAQDWEFGIGAGGGVVSDYEGSQDYEPIPCVTLRAQRGPYHVELTGPELKANVLQSESFQFGPPIRYQNERGDDASQLFGLVGLSYAF